MSSIAVLLASIGQICLNYDMDLRHPILDWYDSSEISSISKSSVNSIIIGMITSFLMALIVFLFASYQIVWLVVIVLSAIFAISRIHLLNVRINHYFNKNEI